MPVRPGSAESPASMLSSPSGDSGVELPLQPITRQEDPRAEYACLFGKGQQIYHIAKVTKIGRNNSAKERAVVLLEERLAQVEVTEVPKTTTHRAQMKRYTRYARIEQLTYQSLVRSNTAARVDRVLLSIPSEYDMVFEFSDDHGPGANVCHRRLSTPHASPLSHRRLGSRGSATLRSLSKSSTQFAGQPVARYDSPLPFLPHSVRSTPSPPQPQWRVVTAKANDDLTKRAKLAAPGFVKPGNTIAVKEKTFVPSIKRATPKPKKLIKPSSSPSSQQIVVTPAPAGGLAGATPVTEAHDIQHQTGAIGARGVLSCHCGKTNLESDPAGYYKCVTCPEASDVVCYACYSEVQHAIESPTRPGAAAAAAPADTAGSSQPARPMSQTQVFSAAEEAPHAVGGVAGSQATTSFNTLGEKPAGRTPGDRDTLRFAAVDPLSAPAAAAPATDDVVVLYTAMKGLGTDEDAIYGVMEQVGSQAEWEQKRRDFRQRYPQFHDGDLVAAMRSDLTQKEFARCESTLQNKGVVLDPFSQASSSAGPPAVGGAGGRGSRGSSPLADTTQPHPYPAQPTPVAVDDTEALRTALTGEGADAAVVWRVLGGVESQGAWIAAQDAYKGRYGADLVQDMRAELTGRELQRCEEILKRRGILVHDDVASSLSSSEHDSAAGASPANVSSQHNAPPQQQSPQLSQSSPTFSSGRRIPSTVTAALASGTSPNHGASPELASPEQLALLPTRGAFEPDEAPTAVPLPPPTWCYLEMVNPDTARRGPNPFVYKKRLLQLEDEPESGMWLTIASRRNVTDRIYVGHIERVQDEVPHSESLTPLRISFSISTMSTRSVFLTPTSVEKDAWVNYFHAVYPKTR